MKTKTLLILSATLVAASALAGCSGSGGSKEKFVISVSARSSSVEQGMLKLYKEEYEKLHPEVEVKIDGWGSVETSQAYVQRYALNRSALTNIIYTTDDTTALLAQKNNFVDLRKYYEADPETDYTNYYATMLDTTSFNGKFKPTTSYTGSYECDKDDSVEYGVYFAPREYNMPGLMLNLDCFEEYGLEVPSRENWNWDAFVALMRQISDMTKAKYEDTSLENHVKYSQYRGIELNHTWEAVYTSIMKELGGDGLFGMDEDYEAYSNIGSDANKAAFKTIVNDFGNGAYKYAIDRDTSAENFPSGTVFMVAISYPEVGNYIEKIPNCAFLPFPAEYVSAGCGGYGILTDKENEVQTIKSGEKRKTVDICWDFIKYIISKDGQNKAGALGYIQPVYKELAETGDWLKSFDETLDHTAFCAGKELALDTFTFATPDKRNLLRTDISSLFRKMFVADVKESEVDSIINSANIDINSHLK